VHQLTISDERTAISITSHRNFADAHRALLRYIVDADRYLYTVGGTATRTRYQLLRLPHPDDPTPWRHPRPTGTATIETLPKPQLPGASTHFAARDACRLIADRADVRHSARQRTTPGSMTRPQWPPQ